VTGVRTLKHRQRQTTQTSTLSQEMSRPTGMMKEDNFTVFT